MVRPIESIDSISRDDPGIPYTQYMYIISAEIFKAACRYTFNHFKHYLRYLPVIIYSVSVITML